MDFDSKEIKFVSSGGLGDAFIILMKLSNYLSSDELIKQINWTHIESSNIESQIKQLIEFFPDLKKILNFEFIFDENYIKNIKKYTTKDKQIIPTPVQGKCSFYNLEHKLNIPFIKVSNCEICAGSGFILFDNRCDCIEKQYDICIQVSGGKNNTRNWRFNPLDLKYVFKDKKICLIGTDKRFNWIDSDNCHNLVGKSFLFEDLQIIRQSKLFIGLSGLMNYWACANKIPNIHLIESADHERCYYHPEWEIITEGILIPSLQSVISCVKLFEQRNIL